jgi:hypothetical protein
MGRPLIGYPNRADDATLSVGSWEAALPLANVQDPDLGVVARSTDAATGSTKFGIDLGAAYPIRCVGVYLPNASLSAQVKVYADDSAAYDSIDYDTGWLNLYPSTFFPASTTFYGEDVSSSAMTQELYDEGLRYPHVVIPAAAEDWRYWAVEIDDTTNSDGYVDVARVWVSTVYRPEVSWRQGGSFGYATESAAVRTQGGKKRTIDLPSWRIHRVTLPNVTEDEATIQCLDIMRRIGGTEQFWFTFDEDDTTHLQRRSYLATLGAVDVLQYPASSWVDVPFSIEEEL